MRTLTPWMSGWHLLGAQVRHWRLARGLSQAELGALTHDSGALIAKVEKAVRRPGRDLARRLDTALDAEGALDRLWVAADQSSSSGAPLSGTTIDAGGADGGAPDLTCGGAGSPTTAPVAGAEIEGMLVMAQAFADADHRSGGGHVRAAVEGYLAGTVRPVLRRDCPSGLREGMLAAAARVFDVAGFTAFDSGDHEASRAGYRQALDLLQAAGADATGAVGHVLTDLAMLAVHENQAQAACDLAQAGVDAARSAGSGLGRARALALLARAHAVAGDVRAARHALEQAETFVHATDPLDEPQWVRFFTSRQLAAEQVYALHRHVHPDQVAALAARAGTPQDNSPQDGDTLDGGTPDGRSRDGMHRRRLLVALTLAGCYLDPQLPQHRDPDRAAELLVDAVAGTGSLTSARILARIDQLRRGIRVHGSAATVRAVEDAVRATAGV